MYTKQNRLTKLSFGLFLSLGLVSCGGGGSSDPGNGGNGGGTLPIGSSSAGCIDGGAPLTGNTTVVVWDGNLCITDGESVNLLRDLKSRSGVSGLLKVGEVYYFTGEDNEHGEELWVTDGTKSGTVLVKDINPGTSGSIIRDMTSINGILYFAADDNDDNNHRQLWRSDGTEAGTMIVKEISASTGTGSTAITFSASVGSITKVNEKLYFSAFSGVIGSGGGQHLWESDGTEAGTKQVNDSITNVPSTPMFLNSGGNKLFFLAVDPVANSLDLWVVDAINTTAAKLEAFNGYDIPHGFININDSFYLLMSTTGSSNKELWVSDGTEPGTKKIKDIPSSLVIRSVNLVNVNGTLYFSSADNGTGTADLWKSDGTEAGTVLVKNDPVWTFFGAPLELTGVNSQLFFTASNNSNILFGRELWASDGTTDGTRVFKDFRPSSDEGSDPEILGVLDNNLLFVADEEENGSFNNTYLWKTDGTEAGTVKIQRE